MTAPPRPIARLARCREGATVVEFALAAPVLLFMLLGIYDLGQMAYGLAQLEGAVATAARAGTLETADPAAEDAMVARTVHRVLPGATLAFARRSYTEFTDIARPEAWNDADGNGRCDNRETFTDENRNGRWDPDIGREGNGGGDDVVLYTVTVTYRPLFAMPGSGAGGLRTLSASDVRRNQPYALQAGYGAAAGTCP